MESKIDISKALQIDGFMSEAELIQLAKWASNYFDIIEIGSYMGRSTRALADNTTGTVLAIDDFLGLREATKNPTRDVIRSAFVRNLGDLVQSGKVSILELNHAHSPAIMCNMCFIDGSHDYDSITQDIKKWLPYVDGLICGHDFDVAHTDVMRAVDELLPGYRVVPGTTLWWVTT